MSKINIQGTVDNIKSRSNVYTPIVEAIVNSIDSIVDAKEKNGEIILIIKRDNALDFDGSLQHIRSIEVHDNGIGFNRVNRDSFDTLYSLHKKIKSGGKGFGRFMYLKYFSDVQIESNYKEVDGSTYLRKFHFGKMDEIIVNETNTKSSQPSSKTILYLNNLKDKDFDKELETIARKLLEKLLIFFINDKFKCPKIVIREDDNSKQITLNEYLKADNEIKLIATKPVVLENTAANVKQEFTAKIFKIYYSKTDSKIILTAHNREVSESSIHQYIPEFEDEFFDEVTRDNKVIRKNFIVKTYLQGEYLDLNISLERESFSFDKEKTDVLHPFSQSQIERQAAQVTKTVFSEDVKFRAEKKKKRIYEYVNSDAPWHKTYINGVDLSSFGYNLSPEKIELELQRYKFQQEQSTKLEVQFLLNTSEKGEFQRRIDAIMDKVTDMGKSDLAHYVSTRKVVLQIFEELRKRNEDGKANLEKEIHSLIYPMNRDSTNTSYEQHNLWLLDERLVFSEYIASDRKIAKKKDALSEPDLVIFDVKRSYRNGENEFSNPLTIFEFKRPKRDRYSQEDDPILQIGRYLDKIKAGKYEMPEGTEPIKVNDNTPVYAYVVCDLVEKIHDFARQHQLTISPDNEGYFGFHSGYKMYVEIYSFKKLLKDATLRNRIFFKKLQLE